MGMRERGVGEGHPLTGKRLGIFGKGGTGKSTVSVLLAREFVRRGYAVCLFDADTTNAGMHRALGLPKPPAPLLEYFGGMVFSGGLVTCPVDDPTPLKDGEVDLTRLPPSFFQKTSDDIYLLSGGKLGDLGTGAGCDGPIAKIARDVVFHGPHPRTLTLVDLKAGIEDVSRGVITKLDWVIAVVDPTLAAVEVAESLGRIVGEVQNGASPATDHLDDPVLVEIANHLFEEARVRGVLTILNRAPDITTESRLSRKVCQLKQVELIGALREDPSIRNAWLDGRPIESSENQGRLSRIADRIELAEVTAPDPETTLTRMPSGSAA
jgi:CO dehydrogenase maturation factor